MALAGAIGGGRFVEIDAVQGKIEEWKNHRTSDNHEGLNWKEEAPKGIGRISTFIDNPRKFFSNQQRKVTVRAPGKREWSGELWLVRSRGRRSKKQDTSSIECYLVQA